MKKPFKVKARWSMDHDNAKKCEDLLNSLYENNKEEVEKLSMFPMLFGREARMGIDFDIQDDKIIILTKIGCSCGK